MAKRNADIDGQSASTATHLPDLPASGAYRADVQGLRALAVLLVVAYHAGAIIPGGFIGVDVFFVISGYVITGMLMRELRRTGRIDLRQFYLRRARRLLPAAALMIAVTLIVSWLITSPFEQRAGAEAAVWASFFAANIYFFKFTNGYFDAATETNPFLHTWSLAVEEQFYLVVPTLIVLTIWLWRRRSASVQRGLVAVALGGLIVSLVASVLFSHGLVPRFEGPKLAFYASPTRAWEFLAGAILVLRSWPGWLSSRAARWLGLVLVVGSAALLTSDTLFPGLAALAPVAGTALLLVDRPGERAPDLIARVTASRPAVWIGDRSYSWYLWHWPALVLFAPPHQPLRAALVGLLSLVPAAIAYAGVEHPLHRRVLNTTARTLTAATVSIALGVSLAVGVLANRTSMWTNPQAAAAAKQIAEPGLYKALGCTTTRPIGLPQGSPCLIGPVGSKPRILLVGDSHAGMYAEPLRVAAEAVGRQLEVVSFGGCPFNDRPDSRSYPDPGCRTWVKANLDYLARHAQEYDLIVSSASAAGYVQRDVSLGAYPNLDSASRAWAEDLARTLGATRLPILYIADVPQVPDYPMCLAPRPFAPPAPGCGVQSSSDSRVLARDLVAARETEALLPLGATLVDASKLMCTPQGCQAAASLEAPVLQDSGHITAASSRSLADQLTAAVKAALAGRGTPTS